MEFQIATNVLVLIGIIFVAYYQKNKISTLTTQLNSQKGILDSVKAYFDIFKIDEVKKYVNLLEESANKQAEVRIKEMQRQLANHATMMANDVSGLMKLSFELLIRVPPPQRQQLIDISLTGNLRSTYTENVERMKDLYLPGPPDYLTLLLAMKHSQSQNPLASADGKQGK